MDATLTSGLFLPLTSMLLASAVIMGSPGPATVSAAASGSAYGFVRSLPYVTGLMSGTATVLALVAAGLVTALLAMPALVPALIAVSGLYILYLAYKIAMAAPLDNSQKAAPPPGFGGGYLLAVANPKAYAAIAAVYASAQFGLASPLVEAVIKVISLAAMIVLIHLLWLGAGMVLARILSDPRYGRVLNWIFAVILVASALRALSLLIR
ncbi:LysE family translocator [Rhizobium sp. L1K21]|uniref:LysE family translocator n=1 Tax=Rhizobium sp. L1K21 TaxID=2954933 RepID=UPI002092D8DD|nr:LysE family transporter [Rhizobium sp. L1K21]MCO6186598.1 LysE family transporter [Rhizobium sp. L1K21]